MEVGITMFPVDDVVDVRILAQLVEERNFHSVWFPDHTHIPMARITPWPGNPTRPLPDYYGRLVDVFIAMAMAVAATSRIVVGSAICILPQRDPIIAAKQLASIDRLSRGRVAFGVGAGWNVEEMTNHGIDFTTRRLRMDEQVQAMKAIWSSDPAEFHGRMVDFDPISCGPRPVQGGGPQVLVGGEGRATLDRIVRYADGWLPRDAFIGAQSLRDRVGEFRETCAAAGRGRLRVVILTKDTESPPDYYADADVDEIVITVPPADASSTARTLDLVSLRYHAWLSSGSGQSPQSVA